MKNESSRDIWPEMQRGRLTLALLEFLIEPKKRTRPVTDLREKDEDTVL